MKRFTGPLLLILLLVLVPGVSARAEDAVSYLSPAPGECWTVTNEGNDDVSVVLSGLDYVVADRDGHVTARDVSAAYPNNSPVIPAGGTAILQNSGSFSGVVTLNGTFSAVRNDAPLLLHQALYFGESCQFTNKTDHSANVLVRGEPSAWVIFDQDGAVTESYHRDASYGGNEHVLSVPAGGRAVITPDGGYQYASNPTSKNTSLLVYCMARSANFTVQRDIPGAWTFGAVGYNQGVAFTNCSGDTQEIYCGPYALYDGAGNLQKISSKGGTIQVPADYTIALGSDDLFSGSKYAFLTDAFQSSDLPGPEFQYGGRNMAVTFRNVSGKAAPLYGVTKQQAERSPNVYYISGLVSPTTDGTGVILPDGASVTVTGTAVDIVTLTGQFSVNAVGITETGKETATMAEGNVCRFSNPGSEPVTVMLCGKGISVFGDGKDILAGSYQGYNWYSTRSDLTISPGASVTFQAVKGPCSLTFDVGALEYHLGEAPIYALKVLHPGEGFRFSGSYKSNGHPYHLLTLESTVDEDGKAHIVNGCQAIGTTIFTLRPWNDLGPLEEDLVQSLTLNKGESCLLTATAGLPSAPRVGTRGPVLMALQGKDGQWQNSYVSAPLSPSSLSLAKDAPAVCFTALEDGCTILYEAAGTQVRTGVPALYAAVTIPQGESGVYCAATDNPLVFACGFNTECRFFRVRQNEWGPAQRGLYHLNAGDGTTKPTHKITATEADATVLYLRDHVNTGPVALLDRTLLHSGEPVLPADVGRTPVDTVSLTLLSERTEPFTLILAAYDQAGRQIRAVLCPVAAGEADPGHTVTLSVPFPCGTDAATIRLFTVDRQFRPLQTAVTLAE